MMWHNEEPIAIAERLRSFYQTLKIFPLYPEIRRRTLENMENSILIFLICQPVHFVSVAIRTSLQHFIFDCLVDFCNIIIYVHDS